MTDTMIVKNAEKKQKKERYQKYYKEHKDIINERRRDSETKKAYNKQYDIHVVCGCGGKYTKSHKAKHETTKKHIQWLSA